MHQLSGKKMALSPTKKARWRIWRIPGVNKPRVIPEATSAERKLPSRGSLNRARASKKRELVGLCEKTHWVVVEFHTSPG